MVELDTLVIIVTLCEINFQTLSAQLRAAYVSSFDVLCESKIMLRCSDSSAALSNLSNCHRTNDYYISNSRTHQQHPSPISHSSLSGLISSRGHLAIETTQTDEVGRPAVPSSGGGREGRSNPGSTVENGRPDKEVKNGLRSSLGERFS